MDAITLVPQPVNEPVHEYAPGSPERSPVWSPSWTTLANNPLDIRQVIGGEHRTAAGPVQNVVQPHHHAQVIGSYRKATADDVADAIEASQQAAPAMAGALLRAARQRLPPRRRPAGRPVA